MGLFLPPTNSTAIKVKNTDGAFTPVWSQWFLDITKVINALGGTSITGGSAHQVLHGGTIPSWSFVSLTTDVSGALPNANIAHPTLVLGGTTLTLGATATAVTGLSLDSSPVGVTTAAAGKFTTLAASSTVSGAGFSTYLASPPGIGGTVAAAGAFTTLSASSTVSGSGFSTYLASPPGIGGTSAAAGKFTTLTATSTISPSSTAGIVGTVTNDNANAGSVGEYSTGSSTSTSISTATYTNVSSISLTAGDWYVVGSIQFEAQAGTTTSLCIAGVSTTSTTIGSMGTYTNLYPPTAATQYNTCNTPGVRISLSSTTTVYLVGYVTFAVSTMKQSSFISARRVR